MRDLIGWLAVAIVLVAIIALCGCATTPPVIADPIPGPPTPIPCVDYTGHETDQSNAETALREAKPKGYLIIFGLLKDYENMRKANPACATPSNPHP